ncbi:phosphoribosyltransferase-like protein [Vibrio splendidus]|uniref:phosphoribosyltransferase-like protein n=1 Tax=Vibrio splendidus TaxID=29497 RepID=UPI000C82FF8A|nr:hypothetical protein [Vibrio splendidus]PMK05912.1 hypothetical protein BCU10_22465 [Vibrio splendidus]
MTSIQSPIFAKKAVRDFVAIMQEHDWIQDKLEEVMFLWEICDNEKQQDLLKELICDFFVLDDKGLSKAGNEINEKIASWKLHYNTSLIVAVADEGQSDGSVVGVKALELKIKPIHEWNLKCFHSIPSSIDSIKNGDTIILFDDFIGSGNKFIKKYHWLCNLILEMPSLDISTLNFHFVAFSGMKFGIQRLIDDGYSVFVCNHLDKGITDKHDRTVSKEKIALIKTLEDKLLDEFNNINIKDFSLGYSESESLYLWRNYSCPNNVFPIFWWPKLKSLEDYSALLPRSK